MATREPDRRDARPSLGQVLRGVSSALLEAAGAGRTALLTRRPDLGRTEVLGRLRTAPALSGPAGVGGTKGAEGWETREQQGKPESWGR
ncbi:hypothetical protein ACFW5D_27750 [Streptomyces sp. NPDC058770]|uniref:hypothetical protein n=1 Tax=Streptomyces sp. NPDC058770 TaxID=3346631 RepID=UPI0036D19124